MYVIVMRRATQIINCLLSFTHVTWRKDSPIQNLHLHLGVCLCNLKEYYFPITNVLLINIQIR